MPGDDKVLGFTQVQVDGLIESAVDKAVKAAKAEFEAGVKASAKELEVATTRAETAEAELVKVRVSATQAEATHIVEAAIKDGKLQKKQKEFAVALLTASDTKVKFGDGEKSMNEVFKEFIEASGTVIDKKELTGEQQGSGGGDLTAGQKVDAAVKKMQSENANLDYSTAFDRVMADDSALAEEYRLNQS